jgi:septum formation protein
MNMKKVFSIILASNSPRRRDILRQIGLDFVQRPVDLDEKIRPGDPPEDYAGRVSLDKARVAAAKAGSGIVIAADTIVALENRILGKPTDARDAHRMLTLLSGRMHHVITGLTVMDAATGKTVTRTANTKVWFRELSDGEIEAYIATEEPLDKAGAYGIQEKGALLVNRIEGCYFNVVGLPLAVLGQILRDFGINLL